MKEDGSDFLYEYLREAYYFQIDRIDKIRDRITFVSGFLLLLGGAISSVARNYDYTFTLVPDSIFLLFAVSSLGAFLVACGLVIYCLVADHRFAYVTSPRNVFKQARDLATYNANPSVTIKVVITEEIRTTLCDQFARATDYNIRLNTQRSDLIILSMRLALISAIALIPAAAIFVLVEKQHAQSKPVEVRIIDKVQIR